MRPRLRTIASCALRPTPCVKEKFGSVPMMAASSIRPMEARGTTEHAESISGSPKGVDPADSREPHDADEVYVVVNDYRRNNWQLYLYHHRWRGIVGGWSSGGEVTGRAASSRTQRWPRCCSGERRKGSSSASTGANWKRWGHDVPWSRCVILSVHPRDGDLILGNASA